MPPRISPSSLNPHPLLGSRLGENSVDLLEQVIAYAQAHGMEVRQEVLDGAVGGICRLGGKTHIFLDATLTAAEQLEVILPALQKSADKGQSDGPWDDTRR